MFKYYSGAIFTFLSLASFNVSAVVINTINGIDYEWMELSETQGLSRNAVEQRLSDANDVLYGYEYASRQQIEDLFFSYSSWDGLGGWHGDVNVVNGLAQLINDLGMSYAATGDGVDKVYSTIDGYSVNYDTFTAQRGFYGNDTDLECGGAFGSCLTYVAIYTDSAGQLTMAHQQAESGWDAEVTTINSTYNKNYAYPDYGSYLVRTSVVPVPAAVWLFFSGLIGLVGFGMRTRTK